MVEVSVVIPTANRRPEKLMRAIRSVLGQRRNARDSVEIIVSTNSDRPLPETVNTLAEQNGVRVVCSAGKRGVSHARNEGAGMARFPLLAFLDDDDWWEPTFLAANGVPVVEEEAELTLCGFWEWRDGGQRKEGKLARAPITIESLYVRNPGFQGSNFVIQKRVFDDIGGFDETLTTSNDKDFLIRFLRRGYRVLVVGERLVNFDRCVDDRLTQLGRNKALGTRRFLEIHEADMPRSALRKNRFKLRMQEAMADRSYKRLAFLVLAHPWKARKILSRMAALVRGRPVKV